MTPIPDPKPKIAVLLASYNGLPWIGKQVESILAQLGVEVHIYISDDFSSDGTWEWLMEHAERDPRLTILPRLKRSGSAGKNFFHLICEVDISQYDYVAFSDQDDIWYLNKLDRHVRLASLHQADGISSNVIAFWPDGRQQLVQKASAQRRYDYLFESAGPGCTFLMTPWLMDAVRACLQDGNSRACTVTLHDWLTYAVCRAHGRAWYIDQLPSLDYRQHSNNALGANFGWKAAWSRLCKMREGWYRREIVKVCEVCDSITNRENYGAIMQALQPKSYRGNLYLLKSLQDWRRASKDRLFLTVAILTGLF